MWPNVCTKIKWLIVRFHHKYFKLLPTVFSSPSQGHAVFLGTFIVTQLVFNIFEMLSSQNFHNQICNIIQTLSWAWWNVWKFLHNFSKKYSYFIPQCCPPTVSALSTYWIKILYAFLMCFQYVTVLSYKSSWNVKITVFSKDRISHLNNSEFFFFLNSSRPLRRTNCSGSGLISLCRKSATASISETVLPCNFKLLIFVPFTEV